MICADAAPICNNHVNATATVNDMSLITRYICLSPSAPHGPRFRAAAAPRASRAPLPFHTSCAPSQRQTQSCRLSVLAGSPDHTSSLRSVPLLHSSPPLHVAGLPVRQLDHRCALMLPRV